MFLASIYRRDYLAPLTSAGYRRRTDDLHVWRVIPWMELAISSLNLPTWPAGPVKWTVGRRRRACSTRGDASYRLRLASFMHIHGRAAGRRTDTWTHDYPIPPRSEEEVYLRTWMHTVAVHSRRARSSNSFFLGSRFCHDLAYACRALLAPTSSCTFCILGLYTVPCLREAVSDLISRLVSVEADPPWFKPHSCAYRVRSVAFSWNCSSLAARTHAIQRGIPSGWHSRGEGIITRVSPQGRTCRRTLSQKESSKIQPSLIAGAACALMTVDRVSLH